MAYTTIDDPELYFQVKTWTGNGSTQSITLDGDENMQPDWVWIKNRGATASHILTDVIRGVTKNLFSDKTETEETISTRITSFDSDGFSLGSEANVNASSNTYVAWNWKAGGSASSNSNGDITSSVSASTTAGFSIVSWTGNGTDDATVGHGLSQKPDMVIIKARENTSSWATWHKNLTGSNYLLFLDAQDAQSQYTDLLKNQSSSVLTLGTNSASNSNGQGFIAYCFAEKKGYSKVGTYTGNGNVNGTFVYTGFKPAMIIIKKNGAGDNWHIYDNKVNPTNVMDTNLRPNLNDAEITNANHNLDFVSNGFKWRTTSNTRQGSGSEVFYMAFAESPFVNSKGIPTNAR